MNYSIQLYTLREYPNFKEVLKNVADMGYYGVEFAGYKDIPADEMRDILDSNGLKAVGSHVGMDMLRNRLDAEIEYNIAIGNKYIICPWAAAETYEQWLAVADELAAISQKVKAAGLSFGYHNHAHEFKKYNGEYAMDILFNNAPEMVMELDTFWALKGGQEPIEYMNKYAGRLTHVHLKDMNESGEDVAVGSGTMDIAGIVATAKELGVIGYVVESDSAVPDGYTCASESVKHLLGIF